MKFFKNLKSKINSKIALIPFACVGLVSTAFADVQPFGLNTASSVSVTSEMLKPFVDGVTGNISVILPVGLVIFAIMFGVNLVPRILRKFIKG